MGSTAEQIEAGYRISQKDYGHNGVREAHWFDGESPQITAHTNAYKCIQMLLALSCVGVCFLTMS